MPPRCSSTAKKRRLVELPGAAHLAVDGRHRAEQQQRLIDEVAAEVAQDAAARGGHRHVERIALEGRLEQRDLDPLQRPARLAPLLASAPGGVGAMGGRERSLDVRLDELMCSR